MLKVDNISITLKKQNIINDISCEFKEGVHGLLGPNGAGKTTFMRGILGLYPVKQGKVSLDNKRVSDISLGYLPQKFGLFPNMSIYEALKYIGCMKKIPKNIIIDEIDKCVSIVNLEDKINSKISSLSGGMTRRVGIAQALMGNPEFLILDEPTAGLDPEERLRVKNIIRNLESHKVIIISTHIVDDVDYLCDYIEIINNGEILLQDRCDSIKKIADNKVFEIPSDSYSSIEGNSYIVKEYEKNDEKYMQVLCNTKINFAKMEPTTEDGYLCALKDI